MDESLFQNGSARILVVDDEARVRSVVTAYLAAAKYSVVEAGSTDEALEKLATQAFDVALVDLDMAPRNGLELLDAIRERGLDVVPVLLTGTTDPSTAVEGMKRGAFDYMPKPPNRILLQVAARRAYAECLSRRREKALRCIVADWEATFNASTDFMAAVDASNNLLKINRAAMEFLDNPTVGSSIADSLTDQCVDAVIPMLAAARATGEPQRQHVYHIRRDIYTDVIINAYANGSAVIVSRDVTEMVKSKQTQADLCQRLLRAQEKERGRLARELHDGLAQSVASLAIGLGALTQSNASDTVQELSRTAYQTLEEIRRLAHGLRPPVIDDHGLVPALRRLAEQSAKLHNLRVEFHAPYEDLRLPADTETGLYRIVQEALANAFKHAGATGIDIALDMADDAVHLCVSDDGCGTNVRAEGMGLADMRERAILLGGVFEFESVAGRGTMVRVRVPREGP